MSAVTASGFCVFFYGGDPPRDFPKALIVSNGIACPTFGGSVCACGTVLGGAEPHMQVVEEMSARGARCWSTAGAGLARSARSASLARV